MPLMHPPPLPIPCCPATPLPPLPILDSDGQRRRGFSLDAVKWSDYCSTNPDFLFCLVVNFVRDPLDLFKFPCLLTFPTLRHNPLKFGTFGFAPLFDCRFFSTLRVWTQIFALWPGGSLDTFIRLEATVETLKTYFRSSWDESSLRHAYIYSEGLGIFWDARMFVFLSTGYIFFGFFGCPPQTPTSCSARQSWVTVLSSQRRKATVMPQS